MDVPRPVVASVRPPSSCATLLNVLMRPTSDFACWWPVRPPSACARTFRTSTGFATQPPSAPLQKPARIGGKSASSTLKKSKLPMRAALKTNSRATPNCTPLHKSRAPPRAHDVWTQSSHPLYCDVAPRARNSLSSCRRLFTSSSGWLARTAVEPATAGRPNCLRVAYIFSAAEC